MSTPSEDLHPAAAAIRDAGVSRGRRLRATAPAIAQTALAAGAAWWLAINLVGHPDPFFAPVAAVVALGIVVGQRARRAAELAVGVAVGVAVADALVILLGSGTLMIALVVALAMLTAVLLGGTRLVVGQAASSAVLVATLEIPSEFDFARPVDALVGGVVAIAVHPQSHVDGIRALCEAGGGWIDGDTVCSPGSFEAAARAAGGAAAMVDALLGEGRPAGAALHRPPGHHAEVDRAMGFCLFNTVAVAARRALDHHGVGRVLILDWDVHHGNGTEDVFRSTDEVLFVSIHQSPLYPGTGPAAEVGSGPGTGYTVNLPVPAGAGDDVFTSLVTHVVVPLARAYAPGLVLISAGYDAHAEDPLAGCEVTDDGYRAMAAAMRSLGDELAVPIGVVLEGGYDVDVLARGVLATMEQVGGLAGEVPPAVAEHDLARAARERLRTRWPALG